LVKPCRYWRHRSPQSQHPDFDSQSPAS
jgi:hypothetical protein